MLGTIPLAHRNITGISVTYGLPLLANIRNRNLITFAIIVEAITNTDTLSLGILNLKDENPTLKVIETEPFGRKTGIR